MAVAVNAAAHARSGRQALSPPRENTLAPSISWEAVFALQLQEHVFSFSPWAAQRDGDRRQDGSDAAEFRIKRGLLGERVRRRYAGQPEANGVSSNTWKMTYRSRPELRRPSRR